MINVILCGGSGTRLWPISRKNLPKQFLKMFNNSSLFQLTCIRNSKVCEDFILVSNSEQYFLAVDQFEEIKNKIQYKNFKEIIEPLGRNTAPAIAFAAFSSNKDEILLVTPSDHLIKDDKKYAKYIKEGETLAKKGFLVTFGIVPKHAETGYGYIKADGNNVLEFCEKPDKKTAQQYIKEKNYFWNSGIFCFKASVYLDELKKYAPEIYKYSKIAFENAKKDENGSIRLKSEDILKIPQNSIDYAVLEKSNNIKMVRTDIKWNDIGCFDALDEEFEKDENGNTLNSRLIYLDSKNNFVFGKYKTIALNSVEDLIVVDTPTALLVSKKGKSQNVKKLVELLKEKNMQEVEHGRTVYRPWGKYTNLIQGDGFKTKLLVINPHKRLSLQKHQFRSEHWVVVSGTATIQIDDKQFVLKPNESTYVPICSLHRISNETDKPLKIIEVQVGKYLEEEDIIRVEDDFGRIE